MRRTLSQVSTRLHIEGTWPAPLFIRRGWARARARRWNDDVADSALRLIRGGHDFVAQATDAVREITEARIFSPALYPSATRVWKRAGYEVFTDLLVMERSLRAPIESGGHEVSEVPGKATDELVNLDRRAFEGFWRMSRAGIEEAVSATPVAALLVTRSGASISGYALVGSQQSVSFLQRVAVLPEYAATGLGTSLVRSSLIWARKRGARTMVLNVRHQNDRARELYTRAGFQTTETRLQLLCC